MSRYFEDWKEADTAIQSLLRKNFHFRMITLSSDTRYKRFFAGFLSPEEIVSVVPYSQRQKFIEIYNSFLTLLDTSLKFSDLTIQLNGTIDIAEADTIIDTIIKEVNSRVQWFAECHGFSITDAAIQFFDVGPMVGRIQIDNLYPVPFKHNFTILDTQVENASF
jgi:hypothetical protein